MSIPAATLMKLATLGLSPDHAEAVAAMLCEVESATRREAEAMARATREAIDARRTADRDRQATNRRRSAAVQRMLREAVT